MPMNYRELGGIPWKDLPLDEHPGQPMCGGRDGGYICTRPIGHNGDHIAHGRVMAWYRWQREDPEGS